MASPHVCGLAAYYLSLAGTAFSPSAEDYTLAGEAVPFHLTAPVEATLSSLSWPSQLIFGKLREWTGFSSGRVEITKKEHHGVTPKVLKNAIVRLSTRGILTVSSLLGNQNEADSRLTGLARSNCQRFGLQQLYRFSIKLRQAIVTLHLYCDLAKGLYSSLQLIESSCKLLSIKTTMPHCSTYAYIVTLSELEKRLHNAASC